MFRTVKADGYSLNTHTTQSGTITTFQQNYKGTHTKADKYGHLYHINPDKKVGDHSELKDLGRTAGYIAITANGVQDGLKSTAAGHTLFTTIRAYSIIHGLCDVSKTSAGARHESTDLFRQNIANTSYVGSGSSLSASSCAGIGYIMIKNDELISSYNKKARKQAEKTERKATTSIFRNRKIKRWVHNLNVDHETDVRVLNVLRNLDSSKAASKYFDRQRSAFREHALENARKANGGVLTKAQEKEITKAVDQVTENLYGKFATDPDLFTDMMKSGSLDPSNSILSKYSGKDKALIAAALSMDDNMRTMATAANAIAHANSVDINRQNQLMSTVSGKSVTNKVDLSNLDSVRYRTNDIAKILEAKGIQGTFKNVRGGVKSIQSMSIKDLEKLDIEALTSDPAIQELFTEYIKMRRTSEALVTEKNARSKRGRSVSAIAMKSIEGSDMANGIKEIKRLVSEAKMVYKGAVMLGKAQMIAGKITVNFAMQPLRLVDIFSKGKHNPYAAAKNLANKLSTTISKPFRALQNKLDAHKKAKVEKKANKKLSKLDNKKTKLKKKLSKAQSGKFGKLRSRRLNKKLKKLEGKAQKSVFKQFGNFIQNTKKKILQKIIIPALKWIVLGVFVLIALEIILSAIAGLFGWLSSLQDKLFGWWPDDWSWPWEATEEEQKDAFTLLVKRIQTEEQAQFNIGAFLEDSEAEYYYAYDFETNSVSEIPREALTNRSIPARYIFTTLNEEQKAIPLTPYNMAKIALSVANVIVSPIEKDSDLDAYIRYATGVWKALNTTQLNVELRLCEDGCHSYHYYCFDPNYESKHNQTWIPVKATPNSLVSTSSESQPILYYYNNQPVLPSTDGCIKVYYTLTPDQQISIRSYDTIQSIKDTSIEVTLDTLGVQADLRGRGTLSSSYLGSQVMDSYRKNKTLLYKTITMRGREFAYLADPDFAMICKDEIDAITDGNLYSHDISKRDAAIKTLLEHCYFDRETTNASKKCSNCETFHVYCRNTSDADKLLSTAKHFAQDDCCPCGHGEPIMAGGQIVGWDCTGYDIYVCKGHYRCQGHNDCPGHTIHYCTGHPESQLVTTMLDGGVTSATDANSWLSDWHYEEEERFLGFLWSTSKDIYAADIKEDYGFLIENPDESDKNDSENSEVRFTPMSLEDVNCLIDANLSMDWYDEYGVSSSTFLGGQVSDGERRALFKGAYNISVNTVGEDRMRILQVALDSVGKVCLYPKGIATTKGFDQFMTLADEVRYSADGVACAYNGLDPQNFASWVYWTAYDTDLPPRSLLTLFESGEPKYKEPFDASQMQAGDVILIHDNVHDSWATGIYVGSNQFSGVQCISIGKVWSQIQTILNIDRQYTIYRCNLPKM